MAVQGQEVSALRAEGLSRTYPRGVTALADVALSVEAGELLVVRGPSGSGKTTLLNCLGGLDSPTSGRVWLGDDELTAMTDEQRLETRRTRLGFVFQAFALVPALSAAENIEVPLRIQRMDPSERDALVRAQLLAVGLADHAQQRPLELSGGQQQRVGIARALVTRPGILLADEPTGQLDSRTGAGIMDLIHDLVHSQGVAAIVTTHDPLLISRADRVVELRNGRLL
jgi:putative ABC transport system ATP-binding protein